MRRSTSQNASSPSKNGAQLMSTMSSATENNARVRSNTLSMKDKVESARRHLKSHQRQFHAGEDSSGGESVENRSPHRRSRSSHRDVPTENAGKGINKHTSSVLYPAELQHVRRLSRETRTRGSPVKNTAASRAIAKSISPTRNNTSFHDKSLHELTMTSSPQRRSTFVVSGKKDSSYSFRGDATFTRRDTFTIDRRDDTIVSYDETVIAPGLIDEEFRPRRRSSSAFHGRCAPKDAHPQDVSNMGKWEVDFLPGSLINARKVEMDRRTAAVDPLSPNAEALRYQEERTRRQEEELRRLVREQTNGRSTKEIFDSWVPLDEERRKRKGPHTDDATTAKKTTRGLWETEEGGGVLEGLDRRRGVERVERDRRVVMEDEAGYAMPLTRDVTNRPLRTPSPHAPREPTPEEKFFTPATSAPAPRLSRVSGVDGLRTDGETPILGRHSTRLSSTFIMDRTGITDRSVHRMREDLDEADRSVGSTFHATPDRRDVSIEGGERSLDEYATPIGRRGEGRRREEEEERSFLNASHDGSRGALNESMRIFETKINRSLEGLSAVAARLTSQLEASRANLSAIIAPTSAAVTTPLREREAELEGVAGDHRLGMDTSMLASLPPMRGQRLSAGGDDLRRFMPASSEHRSSLANGERREEETMGEKREERRMSPIPHHRPPVPSPLTLPPSVPVSSVHGLTTLLDANIGRIERSEEYEREAHRLHNVVNEMNDAVMDKTRTMDKKVIETMPPYVSRQSSAPPIPPPRPSRLSPLVTQPRPAVASPSEPMSHLAIQFDSNRAELIKMYEDRRPYRHRRADDTRAPSPLSPISRSPSPCPPFFLSDPIALRERQTVQGMLDQRAKAVRGTFLHLLQRLYRTRYERRYDDKKREAVSEREFKEEQKREEESFKREANEAKMKAIDPKMRYREFMQWLKEKSQMMEREIQFEVEIRERKRWNKKKKAEGVNQSLLDSSRLANASHLLDERAKKAQRATDIALRHLDKRDVVRRMEREARRTVALAEAPSSARSSIDDSSFLMNQSYRGIRGRKEPVRVISARGGSPDESLLNASRDGRLRDVSRLSSVDASIGGERREEVNEMKEKLEEKRRQADEVRRAMEESQRRMTETEMVSVAAQLAAHDEYIQGVERVGRVIAHNVEPRSPSGLPPGVEPLDLSSLDEERKEGEGKSTENSVEKSTGISGKMATPSVVLSVDSLDGIAPSIPSAVAPSTIPSTGTSHSSSTLRPTDNEELSQLLEEITVDEERRESTVPKKETKGDTVAPLQLSPLPEGRSDELDRSLPSTAASTGRQEISLDTVPPRDTVTLPETTVPIETVAVSSTPIETPGRSVGIVHDEKESIPEEIVEDTVGRRTMPSRALFSPIESSTSSTEESESSGDRGGRSGGIVQRKESTGESTASSEEREEHTLDVSTASLKKAISVASEMANPFDGFESSSGGSGGSERKQPLMMSPAVPTSDTNTSISLDQKTVLEKSPVVERMQEVEEEEEISWSDGGGLEVGGASARSEDFDWGVSTDETRINEQKKEEVEEIEEKEDEKREQATNKPKDKLACERDRLRKITMENEEEEKKESEKVTMQETSSASSSSTTKSSDPSSSSSISTSTSEESQETPRAASVSDALSSASGTINFDDVTLKSADNASPRTPRVPSRSRFRLSLDDSFPDSPRERPSSPSSSTSHHNRRVMGTGSPRTLKSPFSPRTPSAISSPSRVTSPEAKWSRFAAVMPFSPRSGRMSASPRNISQNISLSRELSYAQNDSSFGDISRLSAIELPTSSGGMSSLPPILSSLSPLVSPSQPSVHSLLQTTRPSLGSLNGSSIEEEDEMEESMYDLMDVKTPVGSVLSSLPISDHIGDKNEDKVSPPLTVSARSNGSLHDQFLALNKREFILPCIDREVEEIWRVIEKKGYFLIEDVRGFADLHFEKGTDDAVIMRNERLSIIRGISSQVAAELYGRDLRRTKDGRSIPSSIIPLRRLAPTLSKEVLRCAIENELLPVKQTKKDVPHTTRMRVLGVDVFDLPVEERTIYMMLYAHELEFVQSDMERNEIMETLIRHT